MKYWNLLKLEIEKIIRWFALVFGIVSSFCSFLISVASFNIVEKNLNSEKIDCILAFLVVFTPLLVSIFILVATRKFKELNQLIEENKKL